MPNYVLIKVFVKVDLASRTWVIKLGAIPTPYLYRLLTLKKKVKLKGAGGFYFEEVFSLKAINFFLVIFFLKNYIIKSDVKIHLSIIKSMKVLVEL